MTTPPPTRLEDYLGPRTITERTRYFMFDDDGEPVEVERIPAWFWRTERRRVNFSRIGGSADGSVPTAFLYTLFVGVTESADPNPPLFETFVVRQDVLEVLATAATRAEARKNHERCMEELKEQAQ